MAPETGGAWRDSGRRCRWSDTDPARRNRWFGESLAGGVAGSLWIV